MFEIKCVKSRGGSNVWHDLQIFVTGLGDVVPWYLLVVSDSTRICIVGSGL